MLICGTLAVTTNAEDAFGATDVMAIDGASAVPEPAALTLLTIGGLGLGGAAIRRRHRSAH